jgi:hypothetical protein
MALHHPEKACRRASGRSAPTMNGRLPSMQLIGTADDRTTPTKSPNHDGEALFDSIESAHEYVRLLIEVVSDARRDLEARAACKDERSVLPRWGDALQLASYNLEKLHIHLSSSSRILNDLRSIRRLLFEERQSSVERCILEDSGCRQPSYEVCNLVEKRRQSSA